MKSTPCRLLLFSVVAPLATLAPASHAAVRAISDASYSGLFTLGTPENITGLATITSLTTLDGTFSNLVGATANSVTGTNSPSSVGYTGPAFAPTTNDATGRATAASGLTVNDGANNLGAANFQFGAGTFDLNTNFFVIDTTPVGSTVGDDMTITLIDSSNAQVGSFSLSVLAGQFTNSPANTTNTALATVTYTQNQNANVAQKLGGVTFSLVDMGVTDFSAISTATGIRISSGGLDPNVVGSFAAVPEPSAYGLILGLLGLGLCAHRMNARREARD